MPAHIFWTNFGAGELTEKLDARVDLAKYKMGAHCVKNMVVQVHGGVAKRAGTTFITETKDSGAFQFDAFQEDAFDIGTGETNAILLPFKFSADQSYMLEVGHEYIRVFANRAPIMDGASPLEIVTPYQGDELRELRFAQSADTLYIAHPNHPPAKFLRLTASTFELRTIEFWPPPTNIPEITLDATLTLSAVSGIAVTVTASNPVFLATDNGRPISAGAGIGYINSFTSASSVTIITRSDFDSTTLAPGAWTLGGWPQAAFTPSAVGPINAQITVTAGQPAFREGDVGAYLHMSSGIVKIIAFTDSSTVTGIVIKVLSTAASTTAGVATLERASWSEDLGYPGVVTLFEQRLVFGGSLTFRDTIWGSVVGDYENFGRGALEDDAYTFVIASEEVNVLRWIKPQKAMLAGTVGGEYSISGSGANGGPITVTNVDVDDESRWGSDYNVDAIRAWNVVLFLQRGARKIRELAFSFEDDGFRSPDLSILAEHLTRDGVVAMAYLPQPDSTLLCVRTDGVLLGMTYERAENVVAWHHHVTDGRFVSVATIPNQCGTGDEVWAIVERDLPQDDDSFQTEDSFLTDGFQDETVQTLTQRRYIEVFDGALATDAALVYEGVPASVLSGLSHLEGKVVMAVTRDRPFQADAFQEDTVQAEAVTWEEPTVSGGQVSLARAVGNIEVGLRFTSELELLRPELMTQNGSLQGRRQHYNQVVVRFYCTSGTPLINGERIKYPIGAPDPFTGDVPQGNQRGWHRGEQRILIEQLDPLPMTVLGVGGAIQWEDG